MNTNLLNLRKIILPVIFLLLVFKCFGNPLHSSGIFNDYPNEFGNFVTEVEAEEGSLQGVYVATEHAGYSGSGYVTGFDNDNDQVSINFSVPVQGLYRLVIRYNTPDGEKTQLISVNGSPPSSLVFKATNNFSLVDAGKYNLTGGENSISIIKSWGWFNVDKILIFEAEKNTFNLSHNLVDSFATTETKELYGFLKLQFGKRIISGQTHDYFDEITNISGTSPRLRAGDFQVYTEGYPYLWKDGGHSFGKSDDGTVDELINWYASSDGKGIVSLQWHWHSPTGGEAGTNTFYTDQTNFDVTRAVTQGTSEYDDIIRDIDDIAAELKKFMDAGIPVLWRPLHEAGGGWFWWGAKGPEACLKLYDIIFERMTGHHQLHNLIWVWSTPEEDWYPGNDKVDIIGYDSYPGAYNYTTQKTMFDDLYRLTKGEKLIAMTENGPIPDPRNCLDGDAPWLYFMSWSDLVSSQNSEQHLKDVYADPNVINLESENIITGEEWRSKLYPEDWKPGFKDEYGRYLHDFSYAGYHKGEKTIPFRTENLVNITNSPYNADNTGTENVTPIIQQALDDVGAAGGGIVYLPPGTYKIQPPAGADYSLLIKYDSTVLRGAGPEKTFIWNDEEFMRFKEIILVRKQWAGWFANHGTTSDISRDVLYPSRVIPVKSVAGFKTEDEIIITNPASDAFIAEHKMEGIWTESAIRGVAFKRRIDSMDLEKKIIFIDTPTRYFLKTRDNAQLTHAAAHLKECGIENLSIGNSYNQKSGWDEESYRTSGTGAYDSHSSHAIKFEYSEDSWVKNVNTYKPEVNTEDVHLLSNGILLNACRQITIDSCFFQKPQYEGGGGNGYMYTLQSNDCLIKNSRANHSRHNYDFKYPYSSGNVIHNCTGENSKYSSDFHMYLSMSNLFDVFTVNGDYLESKFRPWGGSAIHGYSSTQSVFYNTYGEAYHISRNYIVDSRQFKTGYIIGTSGPASDVKTGPVSGTTNGYSFDTTPEDMTEGIGYGEHLRPVSLYLDQLEKRINNYKGIGTFNVNIEVKDALTGDLINDVRVNIYDEVKRTNESGEVKFEDVYNSFYLSIEDANYQNMPEKQMVIYSDTSFTIKLERNNYNVSFLLFDERDGKAFWGVNVTLGQQTKVTDIEGRVDFTVPSGEHEYYIDKLSYQNEEGILNIQSDTTIEFDLERTHANIKFKLKEDGTPVNDAWVKLENDSVLSTALGIANFKQLAVNNNYSYSIHKEGYKSVESQLILSDDTTLSVEMTKAPSSLRDTEPEREFHFWPNPANDEIYCYFRTTESTILRITDMKGRELYYLKPTARQVRIETGTLLQSGIYILQVRSDKKTFSDLLIID